MAVYALGDRTPLIHAVPEGAYGPAVDLYVENGRRYRTDLKRLD